jgi:hypothetical protein
MLSVNDINNTVKNLLTFGHVCDSVRSAWMTVSNELSNQGKGAGC